MKEDNEDYYSLREIVNNIKSFIKYLRKRWWMIVLTILAGAGLGTAYYFRQKPKYEAVTTFILEEKSAGGSGLSGLASQFGFNLGSLSGGGSIFSGDNILDILTSQKVVREVLLSRVNNTNGDNKTLADLYLDFTGIKSSWEKNSLLSNINFAHIQKQLNPIQDSVINILYDQIVKKNLKIERIRKQGSIIKVQVTASDCLFARLMSEQLVNEAGKLYMNIRIGTAQENIRQLQMRSDSLLMLLNNKSFNAAAVQPLDINPGVRTASVPVEIAIRDKTVLATLYAEVTKNLEANKLLLSQQMPVIELLDRPGLLMKDNKKSIFFLVIVFSFVGGVISFVMTGALYFLERIGMGRILQ